MPTLSKQSSVSGCGRRDRFATALRGRREPASTRNQRRLFSIITPAGSEGAEPERCSASRQPATECEGPARVRSMSRGRGPSESPALDRVLEAATSRRSPTGRADCSVAHLCRTRRRERACASRQDPQIRPTSTDLAGSRTAVGDTALVQRTRTADAYANVPLRRARRPSVAVLEPSVRERGEPARSRCTPPTFAGTTGVERPRRPAPRSSRAVVPRRRGAPARSTVSRAATAPVATRASVVAQRASAGQALDVVARRDRDDRERRRGGGRG